MASPRARHRLSASLFPLFVSIAAFGPFACSSDDTTTFGKPNANAGADGGGNESGKGGGSAAPGCGDLVACCLQLEGDERGTCQDLATAFASQENGDQNCAVALGGYRKSGACDGPPIGAGGSEDPGDGGAGGEPVASKGGTGGVGGGTSKGGTGGAGGGTSKGGTGGSGGGGGGTSKGGAGGSGGGTSKGGTGGSGGGTSKGGTGGSGGTGGGSTTGTEAAACQAWASSFCSRFSACGKSELLSVYESEADCLQREAQVACPLRFFGRSTWTPAAVGACAADFGALSCSDLASAVMPPSCADAPPGLGAAKDACLSDGDCASRSCDNGLVYFFPQILFTTGSCQDPIEDGEPCVPGEAPFCRSRRCDKTTKTCRAPGEQPAQCEVEGSSCNYGSYCATSSATCLPYKSAGEPCAKGECAPTLGLTCGPGGTCVPDQNPGPGEACELFSICERGSYCQTSFLSGTCAPQLEKGEPCSNGGVGGLPSPQSQCRYPLVCTSTGGAQTCQAPEI